MSAEAPQEDSLSVCHLAYLQIQRCWRRTVRQLGLGLAALGLILGLTGHSTEPAIAAEAQSSASAQTAQLSPQTASGAESPQVARQGLGAHPHLLRSRMTQHQLTTARLSPTPVEPRLSAQAEMETDDSQS
ncbi:hypothetical protein IQ241_11315 [Romeria aff. gracilis LEGE 07310]|uniref:Uncharacterized protein n=1 Tax=Vasconcelosia minhoensis LEGE 07310 TaxID=915328 RepID=A0A8J7ACZ6_9CYAN|nr:hypothetical protein [Romeria gracilis]MBE9077876.1 hypothetical protein [Romeria aff. gracilis LEGE 07310]